MTDTLSLLKLRRSVPPQFLAAPGPEGGQLEELLTIASRVPDHGKLVPWRFIVFSGAAREKAAEVVAQAMGLPAGADPVEAIREINARIGLPAGLESMGVQAAQFEQCPRRVGPHRIALQRRESAVQPAAREAALTALVLDEIGQAESLALGVPLPGPDSDKRLRALCEAVINDPARHATLQGWAAESGAR